ncbi:hypothetical protein [Aeoliella mucimassa]|uniref:hypothetical protein n=1 Tax=Aeoliella mucimassa TaxID=2527972 RepID=UPI0018D392C8|nr:hypothetical protein [Aeoliella mucimassa]
MVHSTERTSNETKVATPSFGSNGSTFSIANRGHAGVVDRYHAKKMAETTLELYRSLQ